MAIATIRLQHHGEIEVAATENTMLTRADLRAAHQFVDNVARLMGWAKPLRVANDGHERAEPDAGWPSSEL